MKKFLINLSLFGMAFFIFDKAFLFIESLSARNEIDKRLEWLIQGNINKDLIIFGSSRGARNIIASQISDSLQLQAYNLSYPGSDIEFHEFLLRLLLKHNKAPKTIVLTIDDNTELLYSESIKFRLDKLYPYIVYPDVLDELVARGEKSDILTKLFVLSRLNVSNFTLLPKKFTPLETVLPCGSMPVSFQKEGIKFSYLVDTTAYPLTKENPHKIAAFLRFLDTCSEKKISLVLVFPPNYKSGNPFFEQRIKSLSKGVRIFHYQEKNPAYSDPTFFHDNSHLTKAGAELFTAELAHYLKQIP